MSKQLEAILMISLTAVVYGLHCGDSHRSLGAHQLRLANPWGHHLNTLLLVSTSTRGQQGERRGCQMDSWWCLATALSRWGIKCKGTSQLTGKDESLSNEWFSISKWNQGWKEKKFSISRRSEQDFPNQLIFRFMLGVFLKQTTANTTCKQAKI